MAFAFYLSVAILMSLLFIADSQQGTSIAGETLLYTIKIGLRQQTVACMRFETDSNLFFYYL